MADESPTLHIKGRVFTGPQEVRDEVWVVGGRITFTPPAADAHTVHGYVLPGLVDAHCHVGLEASGGVSRERTEEHALVERRAGVLLLRDAGVPVDTTWIDDRPDLPRIVRAGRHLARTKRYLRGFAHEVEPDQLVEYVRHEARRPGGWVKVVGDWIDRERGDLGPCWPPDVVAQAIAAAHEEGARITAHCFGEESLYDWAAGGTDCIEHATGLQPDSIAAFASASIAIVPTLVNIANFPMYAAAGEPKFPAYAAHMRDLHARRYATIGAAHDAGVPIYVGTDAGGQLPHGLVALEVAELVRAGLSNIEAVNAASWGARRWLGHPGIEEGAPADLVVYQGDPVADVRALTTPMHIVLRGKVVA